MANLRFKRFRAISNTVIRVQFTEILNPYISVSNITISPVLPNIPTPSVLKVVVKNDILDITTQPLTPKAAYNLTFASTQSVRFSSKNNLSFLLEDGTNNKLLVTSIEEPPDLVKRYLLAYLENNIYNLDGDNLVSNIIDSQAKVISKGLHDVKQSASDNYLEVLIQDELKTRGAGAYDRLNEEGAFEVVRVGTTPTGVTATGYVNFTTFPSDPITLQQMSVANERLSIGNGIDGLIFTVSKSPIVKLNSLVISYYAGGTAQYDIDTYGYRLKSSRYDSAHASTLFTLEDNQFKLNEEILDSSFVLPKAGDIVYVTYDYKNLGRIVDEESVEITQVLDATREVCPPIVTGFSLQHAPVVLTSDTIPTGGGVQFLNPLANPPFSSAHPAFTTEIPYRLENLPSLPGQYCVDYENGTVYVYGELDNDGTGPYPPVATYNYRKYFTSRLDYTYDPDTYEVVANPLREIIGETAKITFDYEHVLIPDIDYKAQVHNEIIDERINNNLITLSALRIENSPITNVFRIYNETTGEIYGLTRFSDDTVYFTSNFPPNIENITRERASFTDITTEQLIVYEESINALTTRVFKILLANQNIMSSTDDVIGSSYNSSVTFSRTDIFETELYFDGQELTETQNIDRLTASQYMIDYRNGIVYVGVPLTQTEDVGTINYKKPTISTSNDHIISVSEIYYSNSAISDIINRLNYTSFSDTEIVPTTLDFSDERYLNGSVTNPYFVDSGTIAVSDDVVAVRHIFDVYDLNNNIVPTDFGVNSTASGAVIAVGTVEKTETLTIGLGSTITVSFISNGIEIDSVESIVRISDGYELWDGSGSISGNIITLTTYGGPSLGDSVVVRYNVKLNGSATPIVDYDRGGLYIDYSYLVDEILVSYEYGDNQLDFRESDALSNNQQYYVTYKIGALRDSLLSNFGTLVDIPIMDSFDIALPRENYRDALKGALQSFTKGPTIPAMKLLVSSITKIDPEIIESVFQVWSLGISNLYQNQIDYSGDPTLLSGKFDNGVLLDTVGQTVTFPVSSNLRLDGGTLECWVIPEWDGLDNDAVLTFSDLTVDGYDVELSDIYIGASSYNPADLDFSVSRFDEDNIGIPAAIHTETGLFIYYDDVNKRWNVLAKNTTDGYVYSGTITTSGEFYDVKFIENLGEPTDVLRSSGNTVKFTFNLDASDAASEDGYSTTDGYQPGYSFDGITFMSDCLHYIFDFAEDKAKNRFSIFKDGKGYLNFEVFDNGSSKKGKKQYKVSTDISDWSAGEKHHIAVSWKLNSPERRDEMHLFIDGAEVTNILRFGGRPVAATTDRFRTVVPEIIAGVVPKNTRTANDLQTTAGSPIVYSPSINFTTEGILIGDTIDIFESGFGTYTIINVSGNYITLNSNASYSLTDARFSVNKYEVTVSSQIDLFSNIAVSILSGATETEIPGVRAEVPGYSISKNMLLENVLTLLGDADAGDQIVIRTLGLNHRRIRNRIYLWGDTQSILRTQLAPPINLDEVKVYAVLLPLVNVNTTTASIVGADYVANFSATVPTNTTDGRKLSVRITGGNVDFTNPVSIVITGTSDGGPTETLTFSSVSTQTTINKWQDITNVEVTVTPYSLSAPSISIEIKEAYTVTDPDGNTLYPVIRYSWQKSSGNNLSGSGTTLSGGFFTQEDVGNKIVISSPVLVAGTYEVTAVTDTNTIEVTPAVAGAFTGGSYKLYSTTIGRSGFQNGFFTFEEASMVNTPYYLPQGYYEFDYSSYLCIPFDPLNNINAYVGSDYLGNNQAHAVIDEMRILSTQLTDVRIGETIEDNVKSITTDYMALRPFTADRDTTFLCHFDNLPFTNDAKFYKLATKDYIQSAESVNSEFNQSIKIVDKGIRVENKGYISTASEGMIEFWVSPDYDTFNDPIIRYYFDASSNVTESINSSSTSKVNIAGRASSVNFVRLQTDEQCLKTEYFNNGTITNSQTINLRIPLPAPITPVKVSYVPSGLVGNRISIYKDQYGFINADVLTSTGTFKVQKPVFWQKNTWHRIIFMYKFNSLNNRDEMRLFVDGEETGYLYYGSGLIYGTGALYGQMYSDNNNPYMVGDINFTDPINEFYIGSTYNNSNLAGARIDNFKISNKQRAPIYIGGEPRDVYYQSNLSTVYPTVSDLYTTYLMNFDTLLAKNEDFAILRDEKYGIFNFIINVLDSFDIVSSNARLEQILNDLIMALKPAHSKVDINII